MDEIWTLPVSEVNMTILFIFSHKPDCFFMFLDLNLSSRATEFNLVLSVCVFLSLKVQLTCII